MLFSSIASASQTNIISRTDGSELRFYVDLPSSESYPIAFLIHGSTCSSSFPMFKSTAPSFVASGIGVIALEKYGINQFTVDCPQAYLENNAVYNRINDHLLVASFVRSHLKKWNKKLIWTGGSEGGQIAALTAPLVSETSLLVMMASGGGLTMAEELPIAFERLLKRQGATDEQVQLKLNEIQEKFRQIKANPVSDREWLSNGSQARNTYKYWDSILWVKAAPLLVGLDIPMLLVHGTEDTSCPIESSDVLSSLFASLGKQNLTYKRYPGLEHNWSDLQGNSHAREIMTETLTWIVQHAFSH